MTDPITRLAVIKEVCDIVMGENILFCMSDVIKFHKKHGEKAIVKFVEEYEDDMTCNININRRSVDMMYQKIRTYVRLGLITVDDLYDILEKGCVTAFLKYVQPLNEAKPNPRTDVLEQRKFWEDFQNHV